MPAVDCSMPTRFRLRMRHRERDWCDHRFDIQEIVESELERAVQDAGAKAGNAS